MTSCMDAYSEDTDMRVHARTCIRNHMVIIPDLSRAVFIRPCGEDMRSRYCKHEHMRQRVAI